MAMSDAASKLGSTAAQAVKRGEQALGVIGWLCVCLAVAKLVFWTADGDLPARRLFQELLWLVPFATMLGTSIRLRTPPRWLEEMGLQLGLNSALIFAGLAIFLGGSLGTPFILAAQFSAALGAIAAWLHWDQVEELVRRGRMFLSGTCEEGERSFLASTFEPLWWGMWILFAFAAARAPETVVDTVWSSIRHVLSWHGLLHFLPSLAPSDLTYTRQFWFVIAALLSWRLFIAFRRVGRGLAAQGFYLWLFSLGEIIGGFGVGASLYYQLHRSKLDHSLLGCLLALIAAAFAWFCDVRRRRLFGR